MSLTMDTVLITNTMAELTSSSSIAIHGSEIDRADKEGQEDGDEGFDSSAEWLNVTTVIDEPLSSGSRVKRY
jgi:hypothetical protein